MLKLQNFSRYYGYKQVLFDVNLELKEKEILCIFGPNGAGKTTLLEGILSHTRTGNSKLFYKEKEIKTIEEHYEFLKDVSYLGHEPGLFYDLTLWENLQFFLSLYAPAKKDTWQTGEIIEYLKKIQLHHRRNDEVRFFSRGMKQRAGLIRCIITNPKILLLDEPLTGLDQQGKEFLIAYLAEFKQKGSAIVITHDLIPFLDVADTFIHLNQGRIQDIYTQEEIRKVLPSRSPH